jgi:rhodanese-related sulfurtransferase
VAGRLIHLFARTGVVLALGAGLGFVVNAARREGLRPDRFALATTCTAGPSPSQIKVLSPIQAVRVCGEPGAVIADVRPPDRFAQGHVAGAVHLPCAARGDAASGALARMAGAQTVVVYGDSTEQATQVAESLRRRLTRADVELVVIAGGFADWDRAGLACTSGPCPDCREQARNRR